MNQTALLPPLIGRQEEQKIFLDLLTEGPGDKSFVYVLWGRGGIGKTRLLEHFTYLADEMQYKHSGIIDLYLTTNQRVSRRCVRTVEFRRDPTRHPAR